MNKESKCYQIIYADPPWEYTSTRSQTSGMWGLARQHYDVMSFENIKDLPVKDMSDDDCFLFMWATYPQLPNAFEIIKSWGFEYKTVAFTWIKKNLTGSYFMGMGKYTRANAEIVLLSTKGKPKIINHGVKQIIETTSKEHSQKPNVIRSKIIELCGDLPRIELFARTKIHGWDVWGNDEKLNHEPLEAFSTL